MNRQLFGDWGIELTPEEFAGALAMRLINSHNVFSYRLESWLRKVDLFDKEFEYSEYDLPIEIYFDSPSLLLNFSFSPSHLESLINLLPPEKLREMQLNTLQNLWLIIEDSYYYSIRELFDLRDSKASGSYKQWLSFLEEIKENYSKSNKKHNENLPPFHLRFELHTSPQNAVWLTEQLSLLNDKKTSVYLRIDEPTTDVGWNWPLRVGFWGDEDSQKLREQLEGKLSSLDNLVEIINLNSENDNCDLLLLPYGIRPALQKALSLNINISADCIMILGEDRETPENLPSLIDSLRRFISTAGVGLVNVPTEKRNEWFRSLIAQLSHNLPIDVAFFEACRQTKGVTKPFLIASRELIKFSKLAEIIKSIGRKMERLEIDKNITIYPNETWNFGDEIDNLELSRDIKKKYRIDKLGSILRNTSDEFDYDMESSSATMMARINKEFQQALIETKETPKNETRWIQAQVYDLSQREETVRSLRALRLNAPHKAKIRIGTNNEEWIKADKEFPQELLPPNEDSYKLTVIVTEPQLFTEPQISTIVLPSKGDSTVCEFSFFVGEKIEKIEARISIVYRNRVLQTALLKSRVEKEPSNTKEEFYLKLTHEAVIRSDFSGLKDRRNFDAAFILNDDLQGQHRTTVIKDGHASFYEVEGLDDFNQQVDNFLEEIADYPDEYEDGLNSADTVELLIDLSRHGRNLFKALLDSDNGNSTLDLANILVDAGQIDWSDYSPKRIQVISTKPESRLPFEFIYNRKSPLAGTGKLCSKAKDGLKQGYCFADCDGIKDPENHVCPLGFWGLSNIIERHSFDKTHKKIDADFRFQAEAVSQRKHLNIFKKAIFAGSDRAENLDNLAETLEEFTSSKDKILRIDSWRKWREEIENGNPTALVLITHTILTSGNLQALEIENGKPEVEKVLISSSIEKEYVRFPETDLPPIVFLIGCETGAGEIEFSGFVTKFRQSGAAIIVCTGASILGRHAIPVTKELLLSLQEYKEKPHISFGEVMRLVKNKMLLAGYPMVLTLMTYGDADWQIGAD